MQEWYCKKTPLGKIREAEINKAKEEADDPKGKKGKGKKKKK